MLSMSSEEILDVLNVVLKAAEAAKSREEHIVHKDQFSGNFESETLFDAICMNFVVIGENLKMLDNKTQGQYLRKYPDIPWSEVIRMRDIVAHHYTGIKNDIIFDTVKKDIPDLIAALKKMMNDFPQ